MDLRQALALKLIDHGNYEDVWRHASALLTFRLDASESTSDETINARRVLILALRHLNRLEDAEEYQRALIEDNCTRFGPESEFALASRANLIQLLIQLEKFEDARRECAEVYEACSRSLSPASPTSMAISTAYSRLNRP